MTGGRNYTITVRTGKDGTQYVRIRETPPARVPLARRIALTLAENLNLLKAGFQKAFNFVGRRA